MEELLRVRTRRLLLTTPAEHHPRRRVRRPRAESPRGLVAQLRQERSHVLLPAPRVGRADVLVPALRVLGTALPAAEPLADGARLLGRDARVPASLQEERRTAHARGVL